MKKFFYCLSIVLLLSCSKRNDNLDTQIEVPVSVEEIKVKSIEEFITTTATAKAMQEATLKSESAGYYRLAENIEKHRLFALGDKVKAGEPIIFLENPEMANTIKLESQKLNLDISQREFEKQQTLYEKGGVTLRELKNSEITFIDAKYGYENALIQLAKLKISSPFDGVIVDLPYYTAGIKMETGQLMAKVMNYRKLYAEVNLPGKEMGRIKTGQSIRVMNYTMPDDTLSGKVTQVSPAIDPETRSFKSLLQIENPEWLLRPGMFVKVEITIARQDSALVIPKDIILTKQRGNTVFIVEKGAAQERLLRTGIENPSQIEVLDGLNAGERLVVRGFETLQNNSKVKIMQ